MQTDGTRKVIQTAVSALLAAWWAASGSPRVRAETPDQTENPVVRYYQKHGVEAPSVKQLLSMGVDKGECRKFTLRGMEPGVRGALPGRPKWWKDLPPARPNMGMENELEVGLMVAGRVLKDLPVLENEEATRYVNLVGRYVAQGSMRPNLPYRFIIIRSDEPTSYAAPGGLVFVTDSLVRLLKEEDELAFVLAHEVAHVARCHGVVGVERAATRRLAGDAFSGLDAGGKGETKDAESQFVELAKDVTKSLMRLPERVDKDRISSHAEGALAEMDESKSGSERPTQAEKESELEAIAERAFPVVAGFRSRVEEFEADLLAVDFLAMAGYRTEAAEAVLGYLKSLEGDPASLADEATHPRFAERQEAVKAHIASRWSGNVRRMAHTKRRFKEFKHLID